MKTNVSIVRCADYEYANIEKAIRKSIELLGKDVFPRKKRVLLKPNLISSTKGPDKPVNTHPVFVEIVASVLQNEFHNKVFIGDSSGGMSYGKTLQSYQNSGLVDVERITGAELLNFESAGIVTLRNEKNKIKKEFNVTKFFNEVDFIISLPKLKSHSLVGYTGAVKNMMGLVPGAGKREMHFIAPKVTDMLKCIVDLYSLVRPNLSIMDAVIGMDGEGPAAGNPKNIGLVLASSDAVALDAVALEIAGYNPGKTEFIVDAEARGLGVGSLENIEVRGESINDVRIKDFEIPSSMVKNLFINCMPSWVFKIGFSAMTSGVPVIQKSICKRCNVCYDSCPVNAIEKKNGYLKVKHAQCIECYCCHELCPYDAIKIRLPLTARLVRVAMSVLKKVLKRK